MSKKIKESAQDDGVVRGKVASSDEIQLTPRKSRSSEKGFSAILGTLPLSKRQLFEKRGVIRTSPKLVSKNKVNTSQKKKENLHKANMQEMQKTSLHVAVSQGNGQLDIPKKKIKLKSRKTKIGVLKHDSGVKKGADTLDISSLDASFLDETIDSAVNQKIIAKTSQHLLHRYSKSEDPDLGKGKEKYSNVRSAAPKAIAKTSQSNKNIQAKTKLAQSLLKQSPSTTSKFQPADAQHTQNSPSTSYGGKPKKSVHQSALHLNSTGEKDILKTKLNNKNKSTDSHLVIPENSIASVKKSKKRRAKEMHVSEDFKTTKDTVADLEEPRKKKKKKNKGQEETKQKEKPKKEDKKQEQEKEDKKKKKKKKKKVQKANKLETMFEDQEGDMALIKNTTALLPEVTISKIVNVSSYKSAAQKHEDTNSIQLHENEVAEHGKTSIQEIKTPIPSTIKRVVEIPSEIKSHNFEEIDTVQTDAFVEKLKDGDLAPINSTIHGLRAVDISHDLIGLQETDIDGVASATTGMQKVKELDSRPIVTTPPEIIDVHAPLAKAKSKASEDMLVTMPDLPEYELNRASEKEAVYSNSDEKTVPKAQDAISNIKTHTESIPLTSQIHEPTTEDNIQDTNLMEATQELQMVSHVDMHKSHERLEIASSTFFSSHSPSTQNSESLTTSKISKEYYTSTDNQIIQENSTSVSPNFVGSDTETLQSLESKSSAHEMDIRNPIAVSSLETESIASSMEDSKNVCSSLLKVTPEQVDSSMSVDTSEVCDKDLSTLKGSEQMSLDVEVTSNPMKFPEPSVFRKATYILDRLFATALSRAFISPCGTIHLYEPPPGGLNLAIVERKLWHGRYNTFSEFIDDLKRVAEAVRVSYDNTNEIYRISKEFVHLFESLAWDMRSHPPEEADQQENQEISPFSAEELVNTARSLECTDESTFYIVKLATPEEVARSSRGLLEKEVCASVHYPFFESFGVTPDVLTTPTNGLLPTVLRVFVSHNRTALELTRDARSGFLLVFTNVRKSPASAKGNVRLQADCFVTKPIGKRHDIEDVEILQSLDSMKSWIKVVVLKAFKFDGEVSNKFRTLYLLKPFRPVKYDPRTLGEDQLARIILNTENHWDPDIVEKRHSEIIRDPTKIVLQPTSENTPATKARKAKKSPSTNHLGNTLNTKRSAAKLQILDESTDTEENSEEDVPSSARDATFSQLEECVENTFNVIAEQASFKELISQIQKNVQASRDSTRLTERDIEALDKSQLPQEARVIYLRIKEAGLSLGVSFRHLDESISQSLSQNYVVGCSKNVHINASDPSTVIQFYNNMESELAESRLTELACLLKLRGVKRVGEIRTILESKNGSPVGLIMNRYQKTLKQYLHNHSVISPHQKYKLMRDLIAAVKALHDQGISHRNLSEVNVMVNEIEGVFLKDGTPRPKVVLIDFRKARFTRKEDIQQWRVNLLEPEEEWLLPRIRVSPDHDYKYYRSIETLPRSKQDTDLLPHSIDPFAEDMYSLGVLLWRISTQQNPWGGVFEDDIVGLRQIASDERRLRTEICKAISGSKCRELIFGCLSVRADDRWSIGQLSEWIWNQQNRKQIISELASSFSRPLM